MKKAVYDINVNYQFDASRKGAKYTFDGIHYMNTGEWKEALTKSALGYECRKDGNTAYDKGSDIPELNASVKSSKASLTNMVLASTFEESIEVYFKNVYSNLFIWTEVKDEEIILYMMNTQEFKLFLKNFSALNERGVIRFKASGIKMINYLENLA